MPLPELDPEARAAALDKARRSRQVRAELKQMLKSGEVTLAEVLARADDADAIGKMRVVDVLAALPAIGKVKAARLMDEIGIADGRRVQGLGHRQREALLERFGS